MGSAGDQPAYTDPVATATAQGVANVNTAEAQSALGNVDTYNSLGSSTYHAIGSMPITQPDGTVTNVTRWANEQTLSPEQQRLYNQQTGLASHLNSIAGNALNTVGSTLSNPISQDQLPSLTTSVGTPSLATGFNPGGLIALGYGSGGNVASGYDQGGPIQRGVGYDLAGTDAHQHTNAPTTFGKAHAQVAAEIAQRVRAGERFGWVKGWGKAGGNHDWTQYGLVLADQPVPFAEAPRTMALLSRLRGLKVAAFVRLAPGALLPVHTHPEVAREGLLQMHVTLKAAPQSGSCLLNVAGILGEHVTGNALVFDGSLPHWALNASDEDRVILYLEFSKALHRRQEAGAVPPQAVAPEAIMAGWRSLARSQHPASAPRRDG